MNSKLILALILAASMTIGAQAAEPEKREVIELKDGTTLVLDAKGLMRHFDQQGRPLLMKDGVQMEGKDGAKYLMKNDAIWKQLGLKGTLHPSHQ